MQKTLFSALILCVCLLFPAARAQAANRDLILTVPAETVLAEVQKVLPLTIPTKGKSFQGNLIVESLDKLSIADNAIAVHGVLGAKNMTVTVKVAGAPINVQLGEVRLPVSCELALRLDPQSGQLFVKPRFAGQHKDSSGQDSGLSALTEGLAAREYPVSLESLKKIDIKVGGRSIRLAVRPTSIEGRDNSLILSLQPQVVSR